MNFRRTERESQPSPVTPAADFTRCRLLLAVILSSLSLGFAVALGWMMLA